MSETESTGTETGEATPAPRKHRRGERTCPKCGATTVRPSRPTGPLQNYIRTATSTRYYRCPQCSWRGRLPRGRADAPKSGRDTLFWVAVVLLSGLVGLMLIMAR